MTYFILIFIASYIIGIIGWIILLMVDSYIYTYGELRKELCRVPAFIPVINIITAIGVGIIAIIILTIQLIYEYFEIEQLWYKIKDKKLPFRK